MSFKEVKRILHNCELRISLGQLDYKCARVHKMRVGTQNLSLISEDFKCTFQMYIDLEG